MLKKGHKTVLNISLINLSDHSVVIKPKSIKKGVVVSTAADLCFAILPAFATWHTVILQAPRGRAPF